MGRRSLFQGRYSVCQSRSRPEQNLPRRTAIVHEWRARLLDNKRLVHQFIALERRTSRVMGPLTRFSPPRRGTRRPRLKRLLWRFGRRCQLHKLLLRSGAADDLLIDDAPIPLPSCASALYVSAAVDATGAAFCYWATNDHYSGVTPLLLLDFDVAQPLRLLMPCFDAPARVDDVDRCVEPRHFQHC